MRKYVQKKCLLGHAEEDLKELYPRNFQDSDLTPEVFSARRETEHWHYRIVRCQKCGLVFSKETLSDEDLFDLYSASKVTFTEHTNTIRKDYWRPLQGYRTRLRNEGAVEVGCSSGFFLDELIDQGLGEVQGFEPSTEARALAPKRVRDQIQNAFFEGPSSVGDKKYGLVCSFQTLDHIPDPVDFLKKCYGVLKPGGLVYFITHNVDSLQAKLLGEKSPIIDVEHIYLFNKKTLPALLASTGFRPLEVGSLKNSYPLRYWARMAPLPKKWKNAALTALKATRLAEFSPAVRAGNMFVIAERAD